MAICPRLSLSDLPALSRDIPAYMFGVACLPGTATATGCPADKAYYTIVVPWEKVVAEGWDAPGGNRYWQTSIPANGADVRVRTILRLMAARSKDRFRDAFKTSKKPMRDILAMPGWVPSYGIVTVEVTPDPDESARDFAARGGYLLWIDPASSPFYGKQALQTYGARPWMGSNVRTVGLWATYDPTASVIGYAVRIEMKSTWKRSVDSTETWIRDNAASFCKKLASPEAITASTAAAAFPAGQPYAAAYGAALSICGMAMAAPDPCTPRPGEPGLTVAAEEGPKIAIPKMAATAIHLIDPRQPKASAAPAPTVYPLGSIAWRSPTGFLIAVPQPGMGTTHRVVTAAPVPSIQATQNLQVVDARAWQRATLPWTQRTTTKQAIGVSVGIGALAAITAVVMKH